VIAWLIKLAVDKAPVDTVVVPHTHLSRCAHGSFDAWLRGIAARTASRIAAALIATGTRFATESTSCVVGIVCVVWGWEFAIVARAQQRTSYEPEG